MRSVGFIPEKKKDKLFETMLASVRQITYNEENFHEDGHVYEVTFDIAFDAPVYDKLLNNYLNVVRTFKLKGV